MTKSFKLQIKKIDDEELPSKNGNKQKLVYHVNRDDNKPINTQLFKDTYNTFTKKYGVNNLMVRAVDAQGMFTFKAFMDNELNFTDFHEYYANKVANDRDFDYFASLEFTVIKSL